jgi:hypothetical protein
VTRAGRREAPHCVRIPVQAPEQVPKGTVPEKFTMSGLQEYVPCVDEITLLPLIVPLSVHALAFVQVAVTTTEPHAPEVDPVQAVPPNPSDPPGPSVTVPTPARLPMSVTNRNAGRGLQQRFAISDADDRLADGDALGRTLTLADGDAEGAADNDADGASDEGEDDGNDADGLTEDDDGDGDEGENDANTADGDDDKDDGDAREAKDDGEADDADGRPGQQGAVARSGSPA